MIEQKFYRLFMLLLILTLISCEDIKKTRILNNKNDTKELNISNIGLLAELFDVEKIEAKTDSVFIEQIWPGLTYVDYSGNIYLVTINGKVYKFNPNGVLVNTLFKVGNGPDEYTQIGSITVDKKQNIFIDDYKHKRIIEFDSVFKFVNYFSKKTTSPSPFGKMICYEDNLLVGLSIFDKEFGLFKYDTNTGILLEKCGSPDKRALKYYSFLNGGDIDYKNGILYYIKPHYYQIFTENNCNESTILKFTPSKFIEIKKRPKSIYKYRVKYSTLQNLYVENKFFILKYWFFGKGQGHRNYDIISNKGKLLSENIPFNRDDPQAYLIKCSNGNYLRLKYKNDLNGKIKLFFYLLRLKKEFI